MHFCCVTFQSEIRYPLLTVPFLSLNPFPYRICTIKKSKKKYTATNGIALYPKSEKD